MEHADRSLPPEALAFLRELSALGVRFLCFGFASNTIEDRPVVTIEIQFEDVTDPRIGVAAATAGSRWFPGKECGTFLGGPLREAVDVLEDPVDVNLFALEYEYMAEPMMVGDVPIRGLSASRVLKRDSELPLTEGVNVDPLELAVELLAGEVAAAPAPRQTEEPTVELAATSEDAQEEYAYVTIPSGFFADGDDDAADDELGSWRPTSRAQRPARAPRVQPDYSARLALNAPLRFQRLVPSGTTAAGLEIVVEVFPDLTVVVTHRGERLVDGVYRRDGVGWSGEATRAMPVSARSMVREDVRAVLNLFHRELLDARRWTADPRALALLGSA